MFEYKGYIGHIEIDEDAEIIHGEVINIRDVITFQGQSLDEIRTAFRESVDDYLDFCKERGEEPEKPYSGNFLVRVGPEVHRSAALAAKIAGKSLNAWVAERIDVDAQTVLIRAGIAHEQKNKDTGKLV